MKAPRPLYRHISRTLAWALAAQLLLALVLMVALVLWPLTDRAAQDKAALIVLSAQTWLELPPGTRPDFEEELRERHGLSLMEGGAASESASRWVPYPYLLERALTQRLELPPTVTPSPDLQQIRVFLWVHGQPFSVHFESPRLLIGRLIALAVVLLGSSMLAAFLAMLMTRRLVRPLEAIAKVAQIWGRGREASLPIQDCSITEVRDLADQLEAMMRDLRQQDQERTTLLAGVSHDLRTPLARLRLALEMLPEAGAGGLRDAMVRDVESMDHLIGQSLQLARSEPTPVERVDLARLAVDMVDDYARLGIRLDFKAGHACMLPCAPQVLRRILGNLIENAWRYGGQQPVELRLECGRDRVRFEVLDRGPGIPEEKHEAVFQPFVRLEPSRNVSTGGSGLGLSIARQLARAQGWRMGLESREGGGTRAWLELAPVVLPG
ncbi:MAG: HAMP domain-containing sensor histidine kinase [Pseudomonadota bacterium]